MIPSDRLLGLVAEKRRRESVPRLLTQINVEITEDNDSVGLTPCSLQSFHQSIVELYNRFAL